MSGLSSGIFYAFKITIMLKELKRLKIKTLVTYFEFSEKVLAMRITPEYKFRVLRMYMKFLKTKPERTHLINFDREGFYLDKNKTLFKGFLCNEDAGTEQIKVPMINGVDIKFADNDIVIESPVHVCDQAWTFEVFAQYFNKFNNQLPLEFNF